MPMSGQEIVLFFNFETDKNKIDNSKKYFLFNHGHCVLEGKTCSTSAFNDVTGFLICFIQSER